MDGGALCCLFRFGVVELRRVLTSRVNNPLVRHPPFSALRGSGRPFLLLKRVRTRHLSLSLTPAFRHSDILWHNVENLGTQRSFSFSFLTPNDSPRLSPCR